MALITAKNLCKYYGEFAAIENVSFAINEGEIVGLLGLNGAGKSTILKILGSFSLPSGGSATVSGFSVENEPDQVRRRIGYLPDRPPLYDDMKVVPYLRYVAKLKDVPSADIDARVDEVIGKTNIQEVAWVPLGELSHGFRQRVGIAQALVHQPKVVILDEPINGLDPIQIVEMRDLILSLRGRHTVILSSHILSEITKTCDRILILDRGKLVAEGHEAELEKKLAKNMKLRVEYSGGTSVENSLRGVRGVSSVVVTQANEKFVAKVETEGDVRSELAKALINAGGSLLELSKEGSGLEAVFMKLVKTSHGSAMQGSSGGGVNQ